VILALMKTLTFISFDKSKVKKCNFDEALENIKMGKLFEPIIFKKFKAHTQKI